MRRIQTAAVTLAEWHRRWMHAVDPLAQEGAAWIGAKYRRVRFEVDDQARLLELRERGVAEQRRRLPPREGDAQRVSIAPRAGAALAPPAAPRLEPALRCGGAWLTTAFRSLAQRSESSARLILYSLASLAYLAVRDRG